jgi:cold shock CspA family protein
MHQGVGMRRQGKIVEWNDARGFGFVLWHGGDERAFAHISAFADRRARPAVGDVVTYETIADPQNRMQATDIRYAGAAAVARQRPQRTARHRHAPGLLQQVPGALFFLAIIAGVVWYQHGQQGQALADEAAAEQHRAEADASLSRRFSCMGKQYCSQMTSCDEARFYLAHCPNTKLDGEGHGDGVPCESQWCTSEWSRAGQD